MRRDADTGAARVVERDGGCRLPAPEAFVPVRDRDVLVLAGDIGTELMAREFIEQELAISPVIYVPGNHEYYSGRSRKQIDADWHKLAASLPGLHYLVTAGTVVNDVRFWGAPWYSDLWGTTDPWDLRDVHYGINDFWEPYNGGGEWTLSRHINHHLVQTDLLAMQAGKVDVVITHWPPTREAIHPTFDGDKLNPYFINDREDLVRHVCNDAPRGNRRRNPRLAVRSGHPRVHPDPGHQGGRSCAATARSVTTPSSTSGQDSGTCGGPMRPPEG